MFKYIKRDTEYKRGQCTTSDMINFYSYRHWQFTKMFEGKLFFNDYSYSVTTSKHQNWAKKELSDYFLIYTRTSLDKLTSLDIYRLVQEEKAELEISIQKGRGFANETRKKRVRDIIEILEYLKPKIEVV